MRRLLAVSVAVLATLSSPVVLADRFTDMTPAERCAYTAKLEVLAAWHRARGTPRDQVKILWHGDETSNEVEFVNRLLDAGYALMDGEVAAGRADTPLELLGDRVFESCVNEQRL